MLKDELLSNLKKKGIQEGIVKAFEKVKREEFIPDDLVAYAYEDLALPIEDGASISQPSTVSFMLELLNPHQGEKILELGSGSGYVLALLSEIIKDGKVYGVELNPRLAIKSKKILINRSIIEVINRSAITGLSEFAPFNRILVSFACPDKSLSSKLIEQLQEGGVLIIPIQQSIFKFEKINGKINEEEFPGFAFVPLIEKETINP